MSGRMTGHSLADDDGLGLSKVWLKVDDMAVEMSPGASPHIGW